MGASCCHDAHLDDPLRSLPRASAMSVNSNQLNVTTPLASVSGSASSSSTSSPVSHPLGNYMSFPFPFVFNPQIGHKSSENKSSKKQQHNTPNGADSRVFLPHVGQHWRKTSNGTVVPLSLLELCVRSVCAKLLVHHQHALQGTVLSPELAGRMMQWLRQHYVLDKPQFQVLVPFLLLEWNLANQQDVEDSWFEDVPATALKCVKSINVSGCTHLQQLRSKGGEHVQKLPELVAASFKDCTELSWNVVKTLQLSTKLTALDLSGCINVNDKCLEMLTELKHLTSLQLTNCYKVTNSGIKYLLPLKNLEKLRLGRCKNLTDEAFDRFAASFLRLRELDVAHCRLSTSAMKHFGQIKSLKVLVIRGCPVISDDSMVALAELTRLTYFDARHCSLVHSIPTAWLQLEVLLLGYTAFSESDVAVLQCLPKLQELDLHKCQLKKRGFEYISRLPDLKHLELDETALTDSALLEICNKTRNLKALNVSNTEISDGGTAGLAKLKELRILRLDTSGITNRTLATLSDLPQLERLDLFGANISDHGLMHLIPLHNLQELTICNGKISDRGVGFISKVTSLTSLNLSQNRHIRSKSILYLRALTGLRCLNLSNTGISAVSLRHLSSLTKIQSLSLYGCSLSQGHIDVLREMLPELTILRCT